MTEDEALELFLDKTEPMSRAMFAFRTDWSRLRLSASPDRYGPFKTRAAAKGSLDAYCKELLG